METGHATNIDMPDVTASPAREYAKFPTKIPKAYANSSYSREQMHISLQALQFHSYTHFCIVTRN
jgi:hypothetical protein